MENVRRLYKPMDKNAYIRKYCHNKEAEFREKNLPRVYDQTAYFDITYYYDDENRIEVVSRYYLGD